MIYLVYNSDIHPVYICETMDDAQHFLHEGLMTTGTMERWSVQEYEFDRPEPRQTVEEAIANALAGEGPEF